MKIAIVCIAVVTAALPLAAQVSDIQAHKLPDTTAVRQVYAAAEQLWPLAGRFSVPWTYATPKAGVKAQLTTLMATASAAAEKAPDNEEIQLLAGEVGAEAYNLDVKGAATELVGALSRAAVLAPDDLRPEWMLASYRCGTGYGMVAAMQLLLKIESDQPAEKLSAGFWSDYLNCAALTFIPEHALRAAGYLRQLRALTALDKEVAEAIQKQVIPPEATRTYPPEAYWQRADLPSVGTVLYSTACGFALPAGSGLELHIGPLQRNTCIIWAAEKQLAVGAAPATLMIIAVQAATPGNTLAEVAAPLVEKFGLHPAPAPSCPVATCLGFQRPARSHDPMGTAAMIAFQTQSPPYPGLRFETPHAIPAQTGGKNGPQYTRPIPHLGRIAPVLDYIMAIEAGGPPSAAALAGFRRLLKQLILDRATAAGGH
ncbi:MAG: hypothetical protein ACRD04_10210 [Terriglobales bacterium]